MKNVLIYYFSFFLMLISISNFLLMMYFIMNNIIIFIEWEIISLNSSSIVMSLLFDWMSLLFMSFVSLISSVVVLYSKSYMSSELNLNRFIILVMLFVLSMMLLIVSPNIISILLGWDGLGLVSYCLVIFDQNIKSFNAGMLTALSNRIGDVMMLMVISWMLNYGSWNYLFYLNYIDNDCFNFIGIMIIIAAMTKSAQIPFSSWLPAAMAAPTPVSSLVHSSTLVTAGVYLLIRFNELLVGSLFFKVFLLLSSLTMFMAGISANYEFDLKKIIAFSTLSQLGLMMSILSMGFFDLSFFHLLTHAMFKALLFMCAGVIIHLMNNIQDIRYMGGISNFLPLTCLCLNISNLSLCGISFLAGFYSKDIILEMVCKSIFMFYISTGLTMFYTIRLLFYLMINYFNLLSFYNLFDEDFTMLKSMFVLLLMSLISGSLLSWMIFNYPYIIYLPLNLKLMVIFVSLLGGFMGYSISYMSLNMNSKFIMRYNLSTFLNLMWFMPFLSTYGLSNIFLNFGYNLSKYIDMGWVEIYSGQGMFYMVKKYSNFFQVLQMNNLKIYLFSFILLFMMFLIMFINFN
uniref:NADH-ubiquinone oxidoreductase chain 5 n=1 Tax=Amorophaga japonica TaxID=1454529 RepID=A0A6M6CV76_9NEOP|nr:NADH dehydrogenase subunit 5 [Amorophaga japonica]